MKAADKIFLLLALLALVPLAAGCAELKTQWDKITGNEEEEAPPAAPSILYITPAESPTSGGVTVTLHGFNLDPASKVIVDGVECPIMFLSAIEIKFQTPPHAVGSATVQVLNPDGQSASADGALTYTTAPIIVSLSPLSGSKNGGTTLTITGYNFQSGLTVKIGGVNATSVSVPSSTTITCTTPAGTMGAQPVLVTNPDTQSDTYDSYTYVAPPPTVGTVSPASGTNMGGTVVTITGLDFVSGCTVTFGAQAGVSVTFLSATQVRATTPAGPHAVGAVNVIVRNPDSQQGVKTNGFTYVYSSPAPTVTAISPTSGPHTGGTAVTVTGTGFISGATLTLGTYPATGVSVVSATQITATTGSAAITANTTVSVTVRNPDTQSGTRSNAFTYTYTGGGGGGGGSGGNRVASYAIDTSSGCDLWYYEKQSNITLFRSSMVATGLHTNGADANVDAAVEDWFHGEILGYMSQYYRRNFNGTKISGTSFNICFVGQQPPSPWVPPPSSQGNAQPNQYNIMQLYDNDPSGSGALGRALLDMSANTSNMPINGRRENNARSNNLGVWTTVIWNSLRNNGLVSNLSPALSTTDLAYVNGTYTLGSGTSQQDARFQAIQSRIATWASGVGTVGMHENGHSVGLVITSRNSGNHCTNTCCMRAVASWSVHSFCTGSSSCTAELAVALGYSP